MLRVLLRLSRSAVTRKFVGVKSGPARQSNDALSPSLAGCKRGNMSIGIHAPSLISVVVSLALAVLAVICFFVITTPADMHYAFWISIMAYVAGALGVMVKTD